MYFYDQMLAMNGVSRSERELEEMLFNHTEPMVPMTSTELLKLSPSVALAALNSNPAAACQISRAMRNVTPSQMANLPPRWQSHLGYLGR